MNAYWRALHHWITAVVEGHYGRKVAIMSSAVTLLALSALSFTVSPPASAATQLYSDDFESDTVGSVPFGWTTVTGSGWSVQLDGTKALKQTDTSTTAAHEIIAGSSSWTDYTFQADVKPGANDINQATVLMARYVDTNNHYSFLLKNHSEWYLGKKVGGIWVTLAQGSYSYTSVFYSMALTVQGSTISGSVNGVVLATKTDTSLASGMIGFSAKAMSEFDNALVTSGSTTPTPTPTTSVTATPTNSPTATPTISPTPSPTISPAPSPTISPTPSPTPLPGSGSQLSVTTSSSGVTVTSLDANLNGWSAFFKSSAGGAITDQGEIDNGVYTELEAQNVSHGRVQMYLATTGGVWLSNLQSPATITLLRNGPGLVALQTVSTITSYHVQWTTTYVIWPDGEIYVQLQVSNIGTSAISLASGFGLELDLGGLPLTIYPDKSPNAWYLKGSSAISPIPTRSTGGEPQLFGHTPSAGSANMGYLLDKYTAWSSQGATAAGFSEAQNASRAKDKWLANLSKLNPGQTLSFLFLLDQQRSLTQAQSSAIDADYRAPSVAVNIGALATSDNEPAGATVINGFNVNLGAYVVAANNNHVNVQLAFPSGVTTRFEPRFKITGWTGGAPNVTWGGQALTSGNDYTYAEDSATHTLYVQLTFDVVEANNQSGQRINAPLDIA